MAIPANWAGRDWIDVDGRFLFGKHKGKLVEDVARNYPDYVTWILENVEDVSDEDREVLEAHLTWAGR